MNEVSSLYSEVFILYPVITSLKNTEADDGSMSQKDCQRVVDKVKTVRRLLIRSRPIKTRRSSSCCLRLVVLLCHSLQGTASCKLKVRCQVSTYPSVTM